MKRNTKVKTVSATTISLVIIGLTAGVYSALIVTALGTVASTMYAACIVAGRADEASKIK